MVYVLSYALMIAAGAKWAALAALLSSQHPQLANSGEFNALCQQVIREGRPLLETGASTPTARFSDLLAKTAPPEPNKRIPTRWGGVVVTDYNTSSKAYKKYLIVRSGEYLSFEKHNKKTETLLVEEGIGVLLFRDKASGKIAVRGFEKGNSITLRPGDEHCLIALSNLIVHEQGVEPLGMDQDLVFIFKPTAAN